MGCVQKGPRSLPAEFERPATLGYVAHATPCPVTDCSPGLPLSPSCAQVYLSGSFLGAGTPLGTPLCAVLLCPGGAASLAAVHLTNSLGSCGAACAPPTTAPISTNLYDLSWRLQLGLQALLPVNDPLSLQNRPLQQVLLPCADTANSSWPDGPYLGE